MRQVCLSNKAVLSFFDKRRQRISFVDIRDPGYDPVKHGGVAYEDAMRHLHVIEGTDVTTGSEVRCSRQHARHPAVPRASVCRPAPTLSSRHTPHAAPVLHHHRRSSRPFMPT